MQTSKKGTLLLGVLVLGTGTIPPPGTLECGIDPTDDALDCPGPTACSEG